MSTRGEPHKVTMKSVCWEAKATGKGMPREHTSINLAEAIPAKLCCLHGPLRDAFASAHKATCLSRVMQARMRPGQCKERMVAVSGVPGEAPNPPQ